MNSKIRSVLFACMGLLFGMSVMWIFNSFFPKEKPAKVAVTKDHVQTTKQENAEIFKLTQAKTVIAFVQKNRRLPDYYITKNEARKLGWKPEKGNLCEAIPGKAIGGDHFGNRERKLPENVKYFEADVNYNCRNRGADRIIYTSDGTVYLTKDHYKTFQKQ